MDLVVYAFGNPHRPGTRADTLLPQVPAPPSAIFFLLQVRTHRLLICSNSFYTSLSPLISLQHLCFNFHR